MRIPMSSDGIGPLIIREKKEDIGSLLGRQEVAKKKIQAIRPGMAQLATF